MTASFSTDLTGWRYDGARRVNDTDFRPLILEVFQPDAQVFAWTVIDRTHAYRPIASGFAETMAAAQHEAEHAARQRRGAA